MNYHLKKFKPAINTENGETSDETIFEYRQKGNIITSSYDGGKIVSGHLIGVVDESGNINMRYHHINSSGDLMTGECYSSPEIMANGKIRLYEKWQWTCGDNSKGESILEEI
jgi:hypothetical protein